MRVQQILSNGLLLFHAARGKLGSSRMTEQASRVPAVNFDIWAF